VAHILIIEDDPTAARLLARELREAPEGYDVLTASSADAGLAVLADQPVDCVVLDYMLPDSRELNCLRAIRLAQPELPVILNTAAGSPSLAEQARRLGAHYVEKHRQYVQQLTEMVRKTISARELGPANTHIAHGIVQEVLRYLADQGIVFRQGRSTSARDTDDRTVASPPIEHASAPPLSLFRLDGRFWTICHDGLTVHLPQMNGLRYLAHLVHHTGQQIEALELFLVARGLAPTAQSHALARASVDRMCDRQAIREVAAAMADLDDEIESATELQDLGRLESARERRAALQDYLRSARGLRGRLRRVADQSERARLNVTKCIRRAIKLIGETHPELARHFAASVKTGRVCAYQPPPGERIPWTW
jgi:CheY-like chemotaxis protein